MGIDLSTSCAGFSLFSEDGQLQELTHAVPAHKFDTLNKMQDLQYKCDILKEFILQKQWNEMNISLIVIEEPMISPATIVSSAILNKFHGMFYSALKQIFDDNVKIDYIDEREARLNAMPEVSKNGKLWGSVPKTIKGNKISDYRKMLIMLLMAQRYPEVAWMLTNNKTINKKNFDQADSIATILGYMVRQGKWQTRPHNLEKALSFIEQYYDYMDWMKTINGNAGEKKALKVRYLQDYLNINEQLNVEVFY